PDDRSAQAIPIAHAFGLTCMLTALSAGACVVLADSAFSPRELLAALRGGGATLLHGSPALWISVLEAAPQGLPGLRTGLVGGSSPSPPAISAGRTRRPSRSSTAGSARATSARWTRRATSRSPDASRTSSTSPASALFRPRWKAFFGRTRRSPRPWSSVFLTK